MSRGVARWVALGFALGLAPASGFAQTTNEDFARAHAAFDRGVAEFGAQHFENAVRAFEESYALRPSPVVLYNLAGAYARVGRLRQAVSTYERYLAEGGASLPAERARGVRQSIDRLRGELAQVTLRLDAQGATVEVDGRPERPEGGALWLDPGAHAITVRASGRRPMQRDFQLGVGARETWDARSVVDAPPPPLPQRVETVPTPPPGPIVGPLDRTPHPEPDAPGETPEASPSVFTRWWFWTGAAVLVAGGVFAGLAATGAFTSTEPPVDGPAYTVSAVRW